MKKQKTIVAIVILILLSMTASQVFAAAPTGVSVKKTPVVDQPDQPDLAKEAKAEKEVDKEAKHQDNGNNPDKPDKPEKPVKNENPDKPSKPENSPKPEKPEKIKQKAIHFRGEIIGLSDSGISVKSESEEISLSIDDNTRIHIPTLGKDNESGSLRVGMKVNGKAIEQEDGSLLALTIQVIPGQPAKIHHVGLVTAFESGKSITVQGKDDSSTIFLLTPDTRILPEKDTALLQPGVYVTIICPRDVTGGALTAKAIVIHPVKE